MNLNWYLTSGLKIDKILGHPPNGIENITFYYLLLRNNEHRRSCFSNKHFSSDFGKNRNENARMCHSFNYFAFLQGVGMCPAVRRNYRLVFTRINPYFRFQGVLQRHAQDYKMRRPVDLKCLQIHNPPLPFSCMGLFPRLSTVVNIFQGDIRRHDKSPNYALQVGRKYIFIADAGPRISR